MIGALWYREVLIRGYVDEVVISCGAEVIARHRRSYDSEDLIFDPLHYLPLIEQKIGALDQAAPLAGWDLPEAFITLRRLLEARMGKAGSPAGPVVISMTHSLQRVLTMQSLRPRDARHRAVATHSPLAALPALLDPCQEYFVQLRLVPLPRLSPCTIHHRDEVQIVRLDVEGVQPIGSASV